MNIEAILDGLVSHAMQLGLFERVNQHEPKNAPGNGLTCAVFVSSIDPVPTGSGMVSTTGRVAFVMRLYSNMLQEPQDMIDPNLVKAVDALMIALSGDFELGGNARNIDLLGQTGMFLSAKSGYLDIDRKIYRVMDISVPVIVNDLWEQAA